MFALAEPWWELLVRGAAVYLMVLVLLRLTGKRLISEGASNALRAGDSSITGAFLVIAVMLSINWALGKLGIHSKRFERLIEGRPRFLIRDGRVDYKSLRKESITHSDLLMSLRAHQCFSPREAAYAVLETDGTISVCKKQDQGR
jgi:uncharacterized membrane protein YcaP (DUF421 family)